MADFDLGKLTELGAEAAEVASTVKALGANIVEKSKEMFGKAEGASKEDASELKKDAEAFFDKAKKALSTDKKEMEKLERDAKKVLKEDKADIRNAVKDAAGKVAAAADKVADKAGEK